MSNVEIELDPGQTKAGQYRSGLKERGFKPVNKQSYLIEDDTVATGIPNRKMRQNR
jgi:hypothetical protein